MLACLLLLTPFVAADDFPPYYYDDPGVSPDPVHYPPINWPGDVEWNYYTHTGAPILDQRDNDPSHGGRTPQNYANVSSNCTDQTLPSVGWYYDDDDASPTPSPTFFFRWRVEQIPNTYGTGPTPQPFQTIDPWKAAHWTVLFDIDGDGFREFAVNIDGTSGTPGEEIDLMKSIYSDTKNQSLDYEEDPDIHLLFHNPTAFIYNNPSDPLDPYNDYIINFRNSLSPSPIWPNGSGETIWDYGTTRSTDITSIHPVDGVCVEYYIDYQIPLDMLDATAVGGPKLSTTTPFCMLFVSANSNTNPLQKDVVFNGAFTFSVDECVPCGDLITLEGEVIEQPVVDDITAEGCLSTTFQTRVRDAIDPNCQPTILAVNVYYYYDKNGNGLIDDGSTWFDAGGATVDPDDPGLWTLTSVDFSSQQKGQYLIGVRAEDSEANVTWSYLTQPEVDAAHPGDFANPTPDPGVVYTTFLNTCGESAEVTKSVVPDSTGVGLPVDFTITVDNQTSSPLTVEQIDDLLPPGFTFVSTVGGTLQPFIVTEPTPGDTDNITWTFSVDAVPPIDNPIDPLTAGTLVFRANVSTVQGTYTNTASSVTTEKGTLLSNPVDVGVGAPRLTILKAASDYSVLPTETVTYTITYSNDSPINTTGVTIEDPLPTGLIFVAATDGGTYDVPTRTITWDIGDLASLEGPYTVSFDVIVDKSANARTVNEARIYSDDTPDVFASATIFVNSPLQIEKNSDKTVVDPGGTPPDNQVTFSIFYENTGTTGLTGVTITDTTPPDFTYISGGDTATEPSGDGYGNDDTVCDAGEPCTVTWNIGNLAGGAGSTVYLTLEVVDPYTELDNPAINTAVISCNELNDLEDSAEVGILEGDCGGVPDTYYFHDISASSLIPPLGLPVTTNRFFADRTAPTSPTATDIGPLPQQQGVEVEVGQFYMDPPLSRASGFSFTGNVEAWIYISKPGGTPNDLTVYLYDYNPDDGSVIQIGIEQQSSCNGKCTNEEIQFSVTPTGIINAGNRLLWRVTSTGRNNPADITFHYDGTGSQARADVCFSPLSVVMDKDVDLIEADPGDTLTYTIEFSNTGERDVTGAQIEDTFPEGVDMGTIAASLNGNPLTLGVDYTCVGFVCTFDVNTDDAVPVTGQLTGGGTGELVINIDVDDPLAPGIESLTNTAILTTDDTGPVEDSVTTDINVPQAPDVSITKAADKTLLFPGDTVTYTLTVVNTGFGTATTVSLSDVLPVDTYFTYVADSTYLDGVQVVPDPVSGGTLSLSLSNLSAGDTAVVTFQMTVGTVGVPSYVEKDNQGSVDHDAFPGPGTTTVNSNFVKVVITTNANLTITKAVSDPAPSSETVGDGATTDYDHTLGDTPVQAGSVRISVGGSIVGVDSGTGVIIGPGLANSTIDYATGDLHLEFLTAPGSSITASYYQTLTPGETIRYTMIVTNTGASDALNVMVSDPIPVYTTYVHGTLDYDGAPQTDAGGDDNAHYDSVNNRVVFTPGDMVPGAFHTLKFSVVVDGIMPGGTTTLTNTATASATNTASKEASADSDVEAAPVLSLSKTAPVLIPYPLTTLNGKHTDATTITVFSTQFMNAGDVIYITDTSAIVLSVDSDTQFTVDTPLSGGNGDPVEPVIKFRFSYTNSGNAEATSVRIKDILQVAPELTYIAASPAPTTDPGFDTNGIVTWELGTLAAGETGTVVFWGRPTATGQYDNYGTMSSDQLPSFDSNTTTTMVGGIELTKSTSTPNVINDPTDGTPETGTYAITLQPQLSLVITGVAVTDNLPVGFTYNSTTSITGGSCNNSPTLGDVAPQWSDCTITPAGGPMTINFNVDIPQTVPAGTYQNPVQATAIELGVLPFDELLTTAEDITVTIPNDIKVTKVVDDVDDPCDLGICTVDFLVTAANVGSNNAANVVVNDVLPPELTYQSHVASRGSYAGGVWTVGALTSPTIDPNNSRATLVISATINTFLPEIQNCASLDVALTSPTDTNPGNNTGCASIVPTTVTLSYFKAYGDEQGRVVIEWSTASEFNTAGFYLFRLDEETGGYRSLNKEILPSILSSPQGGNYSLIDEGAALGTSYTYMLVEIESGGSHRSYGPFTVETGGSGVEGISPQKITGTGRSAGEISRRVDEDGTVLLSGGSGKRGSRAGFSTGNISSYTRRSHGLSARARARVKLGKERPKAARGEKKEGKSSRIKLAIREEGLYYLKASRIAELMGLSRSKIRRMIRNNRLSLSNRGRPVSLVPGRSNYGIFFFAEGTDSIYTADNIYWLQYGRGRQMEQSFGAGPAPSPDLSTFTDTVQAGEDKVLVATTIMKPDSDLWFWDYIVSGNPTLGSCNFSVATPGAADTLSTATMTLNLLGFTDTYAANDHHVAVSLNGTPVGEGWFDGTGPQPLVFDFSQDLLNDGGNTVEVTGVLDSGVPYSIFYIDSIGLTYERFLAADGDTLMFTARGDEPMTIHGFTKREAFLFEVTDPLKPVLNQATTIADWGGEYSLSFVPSAGTRYLALTAGAPIAEFEAWVDRPSSLTRDKKGADYLIIAPEELVETARALADYRQSQGLSSMVVRLEDIMDEFNYGISTPQAIRSFLSHAHKRWKNTPRYVVLAGEGTYDHKDSLGLGENLIPVLIGSTPLGLFPSDNLYVDTDGDHVPEMAVGRLPAVTPEELQSIIDKIVAYESSAGDRIVMLADDQDAGGNFPADSDEVTDLVPPGYQVQKIYLDDYSVDHARDLLFQELEDGAVHVNYIGHAGLDRLAQEGLWTTGDVAGLTNGGGPPVLTALTCGVGQFAIPGYDSLSESLMLKEGGGAAAVWAPSGLSYNYLAVVLNKAFFEAAFGTENAVLGEAILKAFQKYADLGGPRFMMDIYNLQGDPALIIR